MKCEKTSKLIIDKLAGELSPRQVAKLDKHLAACDACRKEFEQLKEVWQLTGETLKEDSFAEKLTPVRRLEILGAAHNKEKRHSVPYLIHILAAIAICIILAGMLLPALNVSREKARRISAEGMKKQRELEERIKRMDEEESDKKEYDKYDVDHDIPEPREISTKRPSYAPQQAVLYSPSAEKQASTSTRGAAGSMAWTDQIEAKNEIAAPAPMDIAAKRAKLKAAKDSAPPVKMSDEVSGRMRSSAKRLEKPVLDMGMCADVSQPQMAPTIRYIKTVSIEENRSLKSDNRSNLGKEKSKKRPALHIKIFRLNLKLWNMTTTSNVRKYLKTHNYPVPDFIKVYKTKNTIIFRAPYTMLKKIEKLFKKLQNEEKELKDLSKGLPFIKCSSRPVSTFSIDTDTASYVQARKMIRRGERPNPFKIRPEEFVNYFDYNYRSPQNSTFAVYPEAAASPFRPNNILFRIGIQGKRLGPDANTRTHYTILLDTSGSMAVKDRMELARKALLLLLKKLKASDYVSLLLCGDRTIVVFRMRALNSENRQRLLKILNKVTPHGVADFAKGISKAYSFAGKYYLRNSSNRIIIISDGIFELNMTGRQNITTQIEAARKRGISNIVIGLGGDGDDDMLEKVAAIGDGSYVFLDTEREAQELFTTQFEARFREIARDVKIQVEFNPEAVKSYRQIGYKNRQLSAADFRNDKVDAGEVGSGQAVTALYELKLKDNIPKDTIVATVRIRYKKVSDMSVEEKAFYLSVDDIKEQFKASSANFKLAAFIAEFAEALRYPETHNIASMRGIADQLKLVWMKHYRKSSKVTELLSLIKRSK